jgi:hypothetical protein
VRQRTIIRTAIAAFVAITILGTATACSTRAPSDHIILYYKNGAGDNKTFSSCIQPGEAGEYPIDDQIFALPTSMRTWNIRPDGKGDSKDPISSGSQPGTDNQPGPPVAVITAVDFYLNVDCTQKANSPIVQFWEKTGRRYGISKDGENGFQSAAWNTMLINTLVTAEEKAIREQTMRYNADAMDANVGGVWQKIEAALGTTFSAQLRAKLGGDYFCGTGYDGGKKVTWTEPVLNADGTIGSRQAEGTCPPVRVSVTDINLLNADVQKSRDNVYKAQQEAKEALIRAQAEVDKAAILSKSAQDPNYLRLIEAQAQLEAAKAQAEAAKACAANPNCTIIIGGTGGVIVGK